MSNLHCSTVSHVRVANASYTHNAGFVVVVQSLVVQRHQMFAQAAIVKLVLGVQDQEDQVKPEGGIKMI